MIDDTLQDLDQGAGSLHEQVLAALKECYDPEIPVNIVDLGLIYDLEVDEQGEVLVHMTLTSVGCPVADQIVMQVEQMTMQVPGVTVTSVELVWDPPWHPRMASQEGKQQLAIMGIPADMLE